MTIAIYPGTFDPVTNGHLDIMTRAGQIFGKVFVAVAWSADKNPLFEQERRVEFIRENIREIPNLEVVDFNCLLVDFARSRGASVIVRGLRAVSDFELEFQLTQMNRHLDAELETIFLMPNQDNFFTSSAIVRQVARYHGDITRFVPPNVDRALRRHFSRDP